MKECVRFAVFGTLLQGRFSHHPLALWPSQEQTDSHLLNVEIKIPEFSQKKRPEFLFYENTKRYDLCSNRCYLYILSPKAPPPVNQQRNDTDFFVLSAIEIEVCSRQREVFKDFADNLEEMMKKNVTEADPKYLYTQYDCEILRKKLLNNGDLATPRFENKTSSNDSRDLMQKLNILRCQTQQSEQDIVNELSEDEEAPISIDEEGNHFWIDCQQGSQDSFPSFSLYEPSTHTFNYGSQITSFSVDTGSTMASQMMTPPLTDSLSASQYATSIFSSSPMEEEPLSQKF